MNLSKESLQRIGELILNNPLARLLDPNPNNHPPILYKYRNWKDDYQKDLLRKNELFMASPGSLNDPFDCRIYENYLKYIDTEEKKDNYILESLNKHSTYFKENDISLSQAKKILEERMEDLLKYQIRSEVIGSEFDDKHFGITCFSEKWDSILMWTHYADNHRGYCIGFDEKMLRISQLFDKIKRVEYSQNYPELDPLNKHKKIDELKYFVKSLDWEYEKEVRLLNLYLDYKTPEPNRIITLDNKFIKEVIIGLNTSKKDREEIISIARDKNIYIWQTIKAEFEFKIERYEI